MLRHHIPQIVSQVGVTSRYLVSYLHLVSRTVVLALARFESPRQALRIAMDQGRSSGARGMELFGQGLRHFPLLIHYHIFKNAGTSFEWALEQALGRGLHRYDKAIAGSYISPKEISSYVTSHPDVRAIATHQAAPPAPRVRGRKVLSSILIRDPIARIRSIYAFERAQESESPGATKAKELDFKGYVEWRLNFTPRMFCNYQVLFCLRDGSPDRTMDRADLARAIAVLDQVDIVGTVERYQEWLSLAESVLSDNFNSLVLATVHQNQTRANKPTEADILHSLSDELGSDLAHHLLEENELDMCLHQVADSLLSRRLAERSLMITLRETYGSARAAQLASFDRQS